MVSRRPPNPVRKALPAQIPARYSPLEKTPHKARNGELPITCSNRHCPKCQTAARERWIGARQKELLPTRSVHVVFTLPAPLACLALQNKKLSYGLLLRASAETLLDLESKAQLASPCSLRHSCRWVKSRSHALGEITKPLLSSPQGLSRVFRGKFVAGL